METDHIHMETNSNILDIHFPVFLPFSPLNVCMLRDRITVQKKKEAIWEKEATCRERGARERDSLLALAGRGQSPASTNRRPGRADSETGGTGAMDPLSARHLWIG